MTFVDRWSVREVISCVVLLVGLVCLIARADDRREDSEQTDRIAEIALTFNVLDKIEPWIRSTDFEGFVSRLALSTELEQLAKEHLNRYAQQITEFQMDAAEKFWKEWASKIVESGYDTLGAYGLEGAQEVYRSSARSKKRVINSFAQHRDVFLEELRLQLNTDEVTWNSAILWLRRQRLLRGTQGGSGRDFNNLPDLIDQFEYFKLVDPDFHVLVKPNTNVAAETAEAVQTIFEEWALQTDVLVDSFLIDKTRTKLEQQLVAITPDQRTPPATARMIRVKGLRAYKLLWSTSEDIASVIEPVVGGLAAERWRRATELVIFPESCPKNSFEQNFSSILDEVTLSIEEEKTVLQLILPLERKLARLRSSMREVALWYRANLMLKIDGYRVPTLSIDIHRVDKEYCETIDNMINLLADAIPNYKWASLRMRIELARDTSYLDRYMTQSYEMANLMFGTE